MKRKRISLIISSLLSLALVASSVQLDCAPRSRPTSPESGAPFRIVFFSVGQGDAALLSYSADAGEKHVLIDTGTEQAAISTLIPKLKEMGISCLDFLVVSHMDSDHAGGIFPILDNFPVKEIILSGYFYSTEEYFYFIQRMQPYNVAPLFPKAGDYLSWGPEITARILNPKEPYYLGAGSDDNNNSLVLLVTYGSCSFLFTGDIEETAEIRIARDFAHKVEVMKVPHHGSASSSSAPFLDAFRPSVSVISCGRDNPYGHPSQKVVDRLSKYGRVYRTDRDGDIHVGSDGQTVTVSVENE